MANRINYFLPYMRQGLAAQVKKTDLDKSEKRISLPVTLTIQANEITREAKRDIFLYGPGDVLGINPRVISKVAPARYTTNFEPVFTPFIEFSEPDLLWRFSTVQAKNGKDWIPWLTLIVLKEGEFDKESNKNPDLPPVIKLNDKAVLPDLVESWRWAHVHILDQEGAPPQSIKETIKRSPRKAVCRLLSTRQLQPQAKYQAFLVPTYKLGLEAALGNNIPEKANIESLSWNMPRNGSKPNWNEIVLPYYHQWGFRTGTSGDFEELVRKLEPRELKDMGTQTIDFSNPGYGMASEGMTMDMRGALKLVAPKGPDGNSIESEEKMPKEIRDKLADLLNVREEKVVVEKDGKEEEDIRLRVTPPVYGEWYIQRDNETIKIDPEKDQWLEELNLDFRYRAAAGLGVQFVKENQEQLIKAAWEQMTRVKKANRELNLGRFGRELSRGMHKRLAHMNTNNLIQTVMPLQYKLAKKEEQGKPQSRGANGQSEIKINMATAIKKNSPVSNMMTQVKVKKYLPKYAISNFVPQETTELVCPGYKPRTPGWEPEAEDKTYNFGTTKDNLGAQKFDAWSGLATDNLNPKNTIEERLYTRTKWFRECEKIYSKPKDPEENSAERSRSANNQGENKDTDRLRPVIWYPEFHRPMYRFLRNLSPEYILPGLDKIPQNTIGLLENNGAFIEAFMLGLNHEFASELRWREFPTDMRGTYFRSFWDTTIYSLDKKEQEQFQSTPIGKRLLADLRQIFPKIFKDEDSIEQYWTKIEDTYIEAKNENEKEIADAYEAAVEKWLLTRDEDKDIDHIANWERNSHLGDHPRIIPNKSKKPKDRKKSAKDVPDTIVILIKGELLLKFGNALVYLIKKDEGKNKPDYSDSQKRIFPVFEGALSPDIVFLGFPIKTTDANKYFLIFEERITDLRFGLDAKAEGEGKKDFSWEHFPTLPAEGYLDGHKPDIFTEKWENAAFIGQVMVQKSVRAAVSLEKMLPKQKEVKPSVDG